MTDDNSNLVDMDDLDAFSNALFEKAPEIEIEEVEDTGDDAPANDEDTDAAEADETESQEESEEEVPEEAEDESDEDADEEEVEEEPKPKDKGKGKKSYQERINELTKARRETERQNTELVRRLEALEAREREVSKQEPLKEQLPQGAPQPDDVDEKGEPKYPLGEFDKDFIRDITKFSVEQEFKAKTEEQARQAEASKVAAEQAQLRTEWNAKLDNYEEEVPEIREHITDLVDTFKSLEPAYGEYLAVTLMQSENGPAIMEYLSQNIGEAQKIVASGPAAATLAIGRLDAKLASVRPPEEEKATKKMSHAPAPPPKATVGRKGTGVIRGDTDDLDAFERAFYPPKQR